MRYLGIDFGEKHIGIALSNEDATIAFPHASLSNTPMLADDVVTIAKEKGVSAIIMGESKNFEGQDNPVMKKARVFAQDLADRTGLPVYFEPEFMTSVEARHIQGGGEKTHASAAALILKSYLERKLAENESTTERAEM